MRRQEGLDRAAQQRGIVARHRGNDQQLGLRADTARQHPVEMQKIAEGFVPDHALMYRDLAIADLRGIEIEGRLAVAAGGALEQFTACRHRLAIGRVAQWIGRILEEQAGRVVLRHGRVRAGCARPRNRNTRDPCIITSGG